MSRNSSHYACSNCGTEYSRWQGKCDSCDQWNTLAEIDVNGGRGAVGGRTIDLVSLSGETGPTPRLSSGLEECNRVIGGGLVAGSAFLVGGDPGIGKSTLQRLELKTVQELSVAFGQA